MAYYRGPQSPRDEPYTTNAFSPPQQRNPNRWSASMAAPTDIRGSLHRRFTTTTVPTINGLSPLNGLSPIGQQRRQAAGEGQSNGLHHRYEALLQQQRQIQEELDRIDPETRREVDENIRHEQAVTQLVAQSEPTTPPEYHSTYAGYRTNRYSTASLTSPPGLATRANRASTQLTSPSLSLAGSHVNGGSNVSGFPSQSVPGSRRHSDDEDEEDYRFRFENGVHRSAAKPNRNSMPIAPYDRHKRTTTDLSLGPINTTGFLFGPDEEKINSLSQTSTNTSPPDTKTFLKVQHTADGFPKLIRSEQTFDPQSSVASSALDLASAANPEQQSSVRTSRHRISLPPTSIGGSMSMAPLNSILANGADTRPATSNRRSIDVKFTAEQKRPSIMAVTSRPYTSGASHPSSFSTSDLPTLKSINGTEGTEGGLLFHSPPPQAIKSVETTPRERNTGMSRLSSARQSHDFGAPSLKPEEPQDIFGQSLLQGNAIPFGPLQPDNATNMRPFTSPMAPYGQTYFNPYSLPMLANGFQAMNLGPANGFAAPSQFNGVMMNAYGVQAGFPGFQQFPQPAPQNGNSAARITSPPRRTTAEEAQQSFNSIKLEQVVGQIYALCKDQHGCRFLQRKLDERNEQTVEIIFNDVKTHMVELMVDPFGNYLCQKLLESCNDDQRTVLVKNAMPAMTKIALNQHGTRALQKMIEFISKPEQTALIIEALQNDVVTLIQDLNGNHVIQKCLNHLSSEDARFIFEAVGNNCVTVGTHRHGCCVLQRCIDHADGLQKGEMVNHVIANANALVQDPFGNYVVQYILDLSEPCFTEPLSRAFLPTIVFLSKQKFSSNVIEKCIRCAGADTRRDIIREIMVPQALEKLLRDSFANYVVQTAMDFADEEVKPTLVEHIRAILPTIRNTPHGRRIQTKITDYDNRMASSNATILGPLDSAAAVTSPSKPAQSSNRANRHGMVGAPQQWPANNNNPTTTNNYGFSSYALNGNGAVSGDNMNNHVGNEIIAPTPQRGNANFMLNGGQDFVPTNGFATQQFHVPGTQAYGQF